MASRLIRLLASGLILNATFPLDAWVATTPVGVAQPAPAQPFNEEQLDAQDSLLEGDGFEPSVPRRKTRMLLVDDEEVTRCLVRQLAPRGICAGGQDRSRG